LFPSSLWLHEGDRVEKMRLSSSDFPVSPRFSLSGTNHPLVWVSTPVQEVKKSKNPSQLASSLPPLPAPLPPPSPPTQSLFQSSCQRERSEKALRPVTQVFRASVILSVTSHSFRPTLLPSSLVPSRLAVLASSPVSEWRITLCFVLPGPGCLRGGSSEGRRGGIKEDVRASLTPGVPVTRPVPPLAHSVGGQYDRSISESQLRLLSLLLPPPSAQSDGMQTLNPLLP
jgi:hypothetical protein